MTLPRVDILGVNISAVNMAQAVGSIEGWIAAGEKNYVCVTGVHGVMESRRDEDLRRIHNAAGLVTPDGMPFVWISRLRGHRHVDRVYGPDLLQELCGCSAARGYRNYFYGGAAGVPERLAERLRDRFQGLKVVGCLSPPFRELTPDEDDEIVQAINRTRPDIVWIGLSTPKQERWMAGHIDRLSAPVLIGVGAAFDFHAGLKRQAPRWIQRSGLEWLYRLGSEPRRLWRRYIFNNPLFVVLVMAQFCGVRFRGKD